MRDVLRTLIEALEGGREQIFCQVVETKGSTPQKAGAVMVVDPAGGQTGTLGGGCVENEVKQHAIRQLGDVGTTLRAFVLDHDYAWADGLICGGKMVIAIEALRGPAPCRRASPRGSCLSRTVPGRKFGGAWRGSPRCLGSDW